MFDFFYMSLKSLKKESYIFKENIARLRAYIWLGDLNEKDNIFLDLNDGYGIKYNEINYLQLPYQLHYFERNVFELRAYIYQGFN
jgi:hypothetical protein